MEALLRNIASNVHFFRDEEGMTQEELAGECGYCRAYITKIERATKIPSLEVLARLAEAFGVAVSELFQRTTGIENGRAHEKSNRGRAHGAPAIEKFHYLVGSMDGSGLIRTIREIPYHPSGLSRRYRYGKELWDVDFLNASDSVCSTLRTLLAVAEEKDGVRATLRGTIGESESVRSDLILCSDTARWSGTGFTLQLFWPKYCRSGEIDDLGDISFKSLDLKNQGMADTDSECSPPSERLSVSDDFQPLPGFQTVRMEQSKETLSTKPGGDSS